MPFSMPIIPKKGKWIYKYIDKNVEEGKQVSGSSDS